MKYILFLLLAGCSFNSNVEEAKTVEKSIDMRAAERFHILEVSEYKKLNCNGYFNPNDLVPLPYAGCTYTFTKNNKKYVMLCIESACGNAYDVENYLK